MSSSVLFMSVSLDGFVAGPNDGPDNPGGDGRAVERLHEWGFTADGDVRRSGPAWKGDHHGMPVFVPSHRPPGPSVAKYPLVTYVADGIAGAMAQAKAAAGDRDVMVQGAYTARRALEAGVLDELQLHQIPVLLGAGLRLFDVLPSRIELEIVRVIDTPAATHLRYRVRR
jgi:dihydrofolate reductase